MRLKLAIPGVLTVAGLVGVGIAGSTNADPVLANASDARNVHSAADAAYRSFAGSEEQQNAGYVLRAWVFNHSMDECMSENGYPDWDWSLSRQYARPTDPLAASEWFATPNRAYRSALLMSQRKRLVAEDAMNSTADPAQQSSILQCSLSTPDAPERVATLATQPATASRLIAEWNDMIADAGKEAGDISSYYECMDSASVQALDDFDLRARDLARAFTLIEPSATSIPESGDDPRAQSPEWLEFIDLETQVTDTDWACRKEVYLANIATLPKLISDFVAANEDEIREAQRDWMVIAREASMVGYAGQPGPLGSAGEGKESSFGGGSKF